MKSLVRAAALLVGAIAFIAGSAALGEALNGFAFRRLESYGGSWALALSLLGLLASIGGLWGAYRMSRRNSESLEVRGLSEHPGFRAIQLDWRLRWRTPLLALVLLFLVLVVLFLVANVARAAAG